jgi:NAD(P)-dependent dehydrogenase (short-subunit alcohol dehydrogenase family)
LRVNAVNPLYLIQLVLPAMIDRGGGTIINVTSRAGSQDPLRPAGEYGQWGLAYGMSKAALDRIAGVLHAEHRHDGILAYTVAVSAQTERHLLDRPDGDTAARGPAPSVPARAIAWLASGSDQARDLAGRWLDAEDLVFQQTQDDRDETATQRPPADHAGHRADSGRRIGVSRGR